MKKILYFCIVFTVNLSFAQDYSGVIKTHLQQNRSMYSLQPQDISDISVMSQSFSKSMEAYTIYVEQRYQGINLFNSTSPFVVKDGAVVSAKVSFTENLASKINSVNPALTAEMAISKAASALGLGAPSNLELLSMGIDNTYIFSNGAISLENIPVQLVYQKDEIANSVRLAWDLSIYLHDASHYYNVRIDAMTGDLLQTMDWVSQCNLPDFSNKHNHSATKEESVLFENSIESMAKPLGSSQYRVFAIPLRNPDNGPDTVVNAPANATASPFGWHDTNGAAGAEFTITRGNNAYAYLDLCDTNSGNSPDGGGSLDFDFPFNLPQAPANFRDAA